MRRLIRQPLVHFFALGAALFVLFGLVNDDDGSAPDEIVVDANRVAVLVGRFERIWQRPPTPVEIEDLIDRYVLEEILYREALALGLDQDDPVVRQRMAQKIEFMFEGDLRLPDDAALLEWLEAHPERYRVSPRYAFEQVFFNPDGRRDDILEMVDDALAIMKSGEMTVAGDPTLLPGHVELAGTTTIERMFGSDFVAGLAAQPVGTWAGPVRSSYGLHLVHVERFEPGYLPSLDEARSAVERDWLQSQNESAKKAYYRSLRDRYQVRIAPAQQLANARAWD